MMYDGRRKKEDVASAFLLMRTAWIKGQDDFDV